jgi:hypothetical protein
MSYRGANHDGSYSVSWDVSLLQGLGDCRLDAAYDIRGGARFDGTNNTSV